MNANNIFLSLLLFIGCFSCDLAVIPDVTGEREVSFTAELLMPLDGGGCDIPCPVNINNTSSFSITSFVWDFGDGTISNEQSPAPHTYTEYGSYIITLTAFNADGTIIGIQTTTIIVIDPVADPVPLFSVENEGCFAPCSLSFTNSSTNAQSFSWNFGDGSDTVSTMSPSHTYAKAGTYTVSLTANNGDKHATITQTVTVNIWAKAGTLSGAGSGKAIFQIEDHAYLIVGNTGLSSGSPFLKKVFPDANGNITSDPTIIIDIGIDMRVTDAALLQDGTIAIIGFAAPQAGESLRSLFLRVSTDGTVETPPEFLLEDNDLTDWHMTPSRIVELPSPDERLIIAGNATRDDPFKNEAFYRVINRNLTLIDNTRIISAAANENTYAKQISGNQNGWVIGVSRENASSDFQAEILVTDTNGNPKSGFPKSLGIGLKTADVLSMIDNQVFLAGLTQSDAVYLAKTGLSSTSSVSTNPLGFNALLNDLTTLADPNRLILAGQRDGKAIFLTFNNNLSVEQTSASFGSSSINGFNSAIQTIDCGFAACGLSGDAQTLFFVKTNEMGQIP
jgi:PKD repeat protein